MILTGVRDSDGVTMIREKESPCINVTGRLVGPLWGRESKITRVCFLDIKRM